MKRIMILMLAALPAFGVTVTLDGSLTEWFDGLGDPVAGVTNLGSVEDPDARSGSGETYTLYQTYDGEDLHFAMDRTYEWEWWVGNWHDTFFIAIDTDNVIGSGATAGAHAKVNYSGLYRPEYIIYVGGSGEATGLNQYQTSTWNDTTSQWEWNPSETTYITDSSNSTVYMSAAADEYAINLTSLGIETNSDVRIWAGILHDQNQKMEVGWNITVDASGLGTAGDGLLVVPEPASLALLGIGALAARRRRK